MTKEQYNEARDRVNKLTYEIDILRGQILQYENEHERPVFETLKQVKDFIEYEAEEGSLFEYEGAIYKVGDYQELIEEYGYELMSESIWSSKLGDLIDGGRIGILTIIKR